MRRDIISCKLKDFKKEEKEFLETINLRLSEILKFKDLTVKALAVETGLCESTLYNYFKNYTPTLSNLELVLKALDVSPVDFFNFDKDIYVLRKYSTQNNYGLIEIFSHNLRIELHKLSRKGIACDHIFEEDSTRIPTELTKKDYSTYLKKFYVGKRINRNISLKTMFFISYALQILFTDFFKEMKI